MEQPVSKDKINNIICIVFWTYSTNQNGPQPAKKGLIRATCRVENIVADIFWLKSGDYGWNGVFILFRLPGSLHIPDGWSEPPRTRDKDFSTVKATNLLEQLKKYERAERAT